MSTLDSTNSAPDTCLACGARKIIDTGTFVHYKCDSTYSREYSKFVSACFVAHDKAVKQRGSDAPDEQAARLLAAIECALTEIRDGRSGRASITLTMALEEHKARLVEHAKGNEMKDKTPPAWATEASKEIDNEFMRSKWASIIAAHSPDAEALAVALESLITHAIEHRVISTVDESIAVLQSHRARFPKE